MLISGAIVNQTPIFRIPCMDRDPWGNVWGATLQSDGWAFPAHWPLGEWVVSDFTTLEREGKAQLEWHESAYAFLKDLQKASKGWGEALQAYEAGDRVPLPVEDDFFPNGYLPFAHQRLGIARAYYALRTFFLWEMGTGKTKTVIDTLRILRRENRFKRALVIAPRVVVPTWVREIEKCSNGDMTCAVWGERKFDAQADFILTTYGKVRTEMSTSINARADISAGFEHFNKLRTYENKPPITQEDWDKIQKKAVNKFQALDYDTLIVDESHTIGDWQSRQTQSVLALSANGKASRRILLTGTAADTPKKLYPQLRCLSPGLLQMPYHAYEARYIIKSEERSYLITGYRNMSELNEKVSRIATWMKKKDCLDLPPLVITDVHFRMGRDQIDFYNELIILMFPDLGSLLQKYKLGTIQDLKKDDQGMLILPDSLTELCKIPHVAALLNKLLQVISGFVILDTREDLCHTCKFMVPCVNNNIKPYTNRCEIVKRPPPILVERKMTNPKLETFEDILDSILESDSTNKVICWGVYTPELDDIEGVLKKKRIGYVRIDGRTSQHVKKFEERFSQDPECRVWLSQVTAGIGINLSVANYAIYYALPWSLAYYLQSLERNNRPGQTRAMTAYRLLTTRALDRSVVRALQHKELISTTLVEQIDCVDCTDWERCSAEGIQPFFDGCKYQAEVDRPIAKAKIIDDVVPVGSLTRHR